MRIAKLMIIGLVALQLSGCFFTKLATTPMRLVGGGVEMVGAVVSIVPVVGNSGDEALEKVNGAIDQSADSIDEIPL